VLLAKLGRLNGYLVALALLTAFGFALRLYDLGYQSLWYDEGYSINAALCVLERGLPILPSGHFYSPGLLNTGLIAASMGLFGETEFAARLPSVLFGTLTIPLVYVFARRFGGKRLALIAAFLVTFSTLEIAWSREARMYQQLQFSYILSLYFFYVFTQTRSNRYLVLTVLSTICTVLSHVLGFSLILIYVLYPLLANIRSLRRLLSKEFLLSAQALAFGACCAVLLVLGGLFLGLFSGYRGTTFNHFAPYWGYLKENFPIILYLALAGAIIFLRKDYRPCLLLILSLVVPSCFIFFRIEPLGFRYLYFMLPVLFTLFAYTALYLATLIPRSRLRAFLSPLVGVAIIGLTVYASGFTFMPQNTYYLDPTAPQPDFKQAYTFVRDNIKSGEVVVDTWPAVGGFYLERPPDYWLAFDPTGTGQDYCTAANGTREVYTDALCIKDLDTLKGAAANSQSGWLVIDGLAEFRLPTATVAFIRENMTLYHREGGTDDPAGLVEVYRWTR